MLECVFLPYRDSNQILLLFLSGKFLRKKKKRLMPLATKNIRAGFNMHSSRLMSYTHHPVCWTWSLVCRVPDWETKPGRISSALKCVIPPRKQHFLKSRGVFIKCLLNVQQVSSSGQLCGECWDLHPSHSIALKSLLDLHSFSGASSIQGTC